MERDLCWRESGSVLYIAKGSDLPRRCVKCNGPVTPPVKRKTFYWHASGWYLLVLFNLLIYAIVAMFIRKKIQLSPGLCDEHRKRRNGRVAGSLALAAVSFVGGVAAYGNDSAGLSLACFAGTLGALVLAMFSGRTLYPVEINERGARFKGCGKAFLSSLSSSRRF